VLQIVRATTAFSIAILDRQKGTVTFHSYRQ
jgi:hypothetical protein